MELRRQREVPAHRLHPDATASQADAAATGSATGAGAAAITMRISMRLRPSSLLFLFVAFAAAVAFAQTESTPITASAVWQPGNDFLAKAHAACDKVSPSQKFGECVMNQMSKAGAPADSVNFTRELLKISGGELGILSGFQKVGPVDIAWVLYPLRSTYVLFLV